MTKKQCPKCNNEFSTRGGNYNKHISVCNGTYKKFVKRTCCEYCELDFAGLTASERANHSRWCIHNPKHEEYIDKAKSISDKIRNLVSEESFERMILGIKKAHADGKYVNASSKGIETKKKNGTLLHRPETKELLSQKALASKHRRLVRSVREYTKKDGTVVMLDSSWEEVLAIRLDEIGIIWIRPEEPIPYNTSDGKSHNYFPDFYLPDYDLYLDPKNPAAVKSQKEKLDVLLKIMDNLIIIESLEDCKNFIL